MKELDALVDGAYAAPKKGPKCWAQRLKGEEAQTFLAELEKRATAGDPPVYTKVTSLLREHFSIRVSGTSVSRHFRGDCACR